MAHVFTTKLTRTRLVNISPKPALLVNISPKPPMLDPAVVAAALGADIVGRTAPPPVAPAAAAPLPVAPAEPLRKTA